MDKTRYLNMIIALLCTVIICFIYYILYIPSNQPWYIALPLSVIPSIVATSIIALSIYWFIERAEVVTKILKENSDIMLELRRINRIKGVTRYYTDFRDVEWDDIFSKSNNVDIIVSYCDSWINTQRPHLEQFFLRGGRLRIFLGDPNNADVITVTKLRFPDRSLEQLLEKINNTHTRLKSMCSKVGAGSVEARYIPEPPSYSAFIFDERSVLLSVYEQFRADHISSPAFLLDVDSSISAKSFWQKELDGFVKSGKVI